MLGCDSKHVPPGWENMWEDIFKNPTNDNKRRFCETFGSYFITFSRTEDRLRLVNEATTQGLNTDISSPLQRLYLDEGETDRVLSDVVKDAFNINIRLDESGLEKLILRVGEKFDHIPPEAKKARLLLSQFEKVDDQGDGIKSFVATVLSMIVLKRPITLIDEPEAFLHPPQAMKLGEFIGEYAIADHQTVIVTHSSDFLKGILSKRRNIAVIRIDRSKNQNKIYLLDPANLEKILNNPLLSSARILEAIFYKGAVIVEGDSDSVFYQRVSRTIRNSDDIHYAHAYNKQTVYKVTEPYSQTAAAHPAASKRGMRGAAA